MKKGILSLSVVLVLLAGAAACPAQQKEGSSSDDPVTRAKAFVELLTSGDFVGATKHFDATMNAAMPAEKLQEVWKSLVGQFGPFKEQAGVRTEKVKQYDRVIVTCTFEKATLDARVVFNSAGQIAGLFFAPGRPPAAEYVRPPYAVPDRFTAKEVMIGTGEWTLPGTLTVPAGPGPFPALVLVHGSGPHDRDETIGPNKPFRDLAEGLSSRGIAVLRYEKRTKAHAARTAAIKDGFTVMEETVEDALAAVSLLRHTEGIDARRVFVLGHSLGGMLIPRIGMLDPDIAGFVVLAGNTRPLEDLILDQTSYLLALDNTAPESQKKKKLEQVKALVDRVKDPKLSVSSTEPLFFAPPKYWLDLRGYRPAETARHLKQPMLILRGERDYQVTAEDFEGWKQALSDRKNVVFKTYPKLSHLFTEGEGKGTPRDYETPGHVAEGVIADIAGWIKNP